VAEIVYVVLVDTTELVIGNLTDVAPAGTVTVAGTTTPAEAVIETTAPPAGAGPVRYTRLSQLVAPPTTERRNSELAAAGSTVTTVVFDVAPEVAVIVTFVFAATTEVLMVKFAYVKPAGTVTVAGTVAVGLELDRVTTVPPAGAAAASHTLFPVLEFPPVTVAGFAATEDSGVPFEVAAVTLTLPDRDTPS